MTKDYNTFIKLYKSAPSSIRSLIDSEAIGELAEELIFEHSIEKEQKKTLISVIADLILDSSLNTREEMAKINSEPDKLNDITNKIDLFIKKTQSEQQKNAFQTKNDPVNLDQDIAQAEAEIKSIPTIHTMQDDVKSTSQEDILKNRQSDQN